MQKLKGYIEQVRGVSYKPIDVRDAQSGVAVLRANNIQDKVDMSDLIFVDAKKIAESQYLKEGDVLICASSGSKNLVGKAVVIPNDLDAAFGAFCKVVRIKAVSDVNPEFIRLFFLSKNYRDAISECSVGANINNIKTDHLDNLRINIPNYNIQCFAVEYLHKLQRAIDLKRKQLNDLDELVKSKFQEMFGDPIENEKGWDVKKLEEIVAEGCSISYGIVQPGIGVEDGVPVVRPVDMINTFVSRQGLKQTTKEISNSYKRTVLKGNEILLCVRGITGMVALASEELKGCNVTRGIAPIECNERNNRWFVYYQFLTNGIQQHIAEHTKGIALKQINMEDVRKIPFIIPPIEQQTCFAEFAQKVYAANEIVNQEMTNLEELMESKMDKCFGEKDEP